MALLPSIEDSLLYKLYINKGLNHIVTIFIISLLVSCFFCLSENVLIVVIITAFLLFVTLFMFNKLIYLYLTYLLISPVVEQLIAKTPFIWNPSVYMKALTLIIFAFYLIDKKIEIATTMINRPLIVLLILFTLTLPLAVNLQSSFVDLVKLFHFITVVSITYYLVKANYYNALLLWNAQLFSAIIAVFSIIFAGVVGGISIVSQSYGAGALSGHYNTGIASVLASNFSLALLYPQFSKRYNKIAYLLAVVIALTVLATFNRTAIIVLLYQMLICGLIGVRRFRKWSISRASIFISVLFLISCIYINRFPNTLQSRINNIRFAYQDEEIFASGRFLLWRQAIQYFEKMDILQKFVGSGLGTAPYYIYSKMNVGTHNFFIRLLLEGGVIALVTYLWLLCSIIKYVFNYSHNSPQLRTLGLAIVGSIILTSLWQDGIFLLTQMQTTVAATIAIIYRKITPLK